MANRAPTPEFQRPLLLTALRILVLSIVSGLLAGATSYVFLTVLDRITDTRMRHDSLVWFLPIAGFILGWAYLRCDPRAAAGNATIVQELHQAEQGVPFQLAPMSLIGTWVTHLFGGSGGREGTAIQMSAAITDSIARRMQCTKFERRMLLHVAIGGAFGAVFGVPFAGTVFGVEEPGRKGLGLRALVPTAVAAFVGDGVVRGLGYHHKVRHAIVPQFSLGLVAKLAVAAIAFGMTARLYVYLSVLIRWLGSRLRRPALATAAGGVWILALALIFGRQYLGLSVPLADSALAGTSIAGGAFLLKLVFTAITSGSGFRAGEVTPLFVIGAALGAVLATPLGTDAKILAAVGFVAVFGAAAKVPIACAVMGVELFGGHAVPALLFTCVIARIVSGHPSIYPRSPNLGIGATRS